MSSSKNIEFEQTSFLSKSNSAFIEDMYLKYIEKDPNLPESWKKYFETLGEDLDLIIREIEGPSWNKNRKKINLQKKSHENKNFYNNEEIEKDKADSIRAIALIRAYRIRGHLIANLDPLEMMERKYLHELHPSDHGFNKEDYDKKIFLHSYMEKGYSTVNEIISNLKRIYCSNIGVEYMHISDPIEKVWFRNRMEKEENRINFTNTGKKQY